MYVLYNMAEKLFNSSCILNCFFKPLRMGNNILKLVWRKIYKGDIYSLINFFGLSIGIATCLVIFLYVADELSYDRDQPKATSTYRILLNSPSRNSTTAIMPAVMYTHLDDRIPSIDQIGRFWFFNHDQVMTHNKRTFIEKGLAMADADCLNIFSFVFIKGSAENALSHPHSIILTRDASVRYFGNEEPIGQELVFENRYTFVVSAVIENIPSQSHLQFSMLASLEAMRSINSSVMTQWGNQSVYFYVQLADNANVAHVENQITQAVWQANERYKDRLFYQLQPLTDIHLKSKHVEWDLSGRGSIVMVRVFSFIAVLVLILACFNFVNLSLAMAVKRSKEIGIKKTLGASRYQLMVQFLAETFAVAFISLLLAVVLTELSLPILNQLTGKSLILNFFTQGYLIPFLILLLALVSVGAGLYPAVILSNSQPVQVMKGSRTSGFVDKNGRRVISFRLRQMLMLLQFSISTALIVVSLAIFIQMKYVIDRSPGFTKEGLIAIRNPMDNNMKHRAEWLKTQLQQFPPINAVCLAHNIPGFKPNNYASFSFETAAGKQSLNGAIISCDEGFFSTLQARIIEGRDFSVEYATDMNNSAVINSAMKSRMAVEEPLGMHLEGFYDNVQRRIIGVVDDIHFSSLHDAVDPMVYIISSDNYPQFYFNVLARFDKSRIGEIVKHLEKIWPVEAASWPLQYHFLEDSINVQYQDDKRTMVIIMIFTTLAVLLSVMGLMGVALHSASTRTKEIGIRKVLGAGILDIIRTVSKEYTLLVIISNLIAWPAAWYIISGWLDNFAYRTTIQWYMFLGPSLVIFFFATLVMISIAYTAASQNPVNTLKSGE
jgi:putative ABC transport system permease protein